MKPVFFKTSAEFRAWLKKHHADRTELYLGYYKAGSRKKGITYPEAVDEALCFGWIDGVRKSISEETSMQRFTPRRKKSYWSAINIKKAEALIAAGRMHPAGLKVFEARDRSAKGLYSFENRPQELNGEWLKRLEQRPKAHAFHLAQPPYYRKTVAFWVTSAKQEATRERRFQQLIDHAEAGRRIPQLVSPGTADRKKP